MKLGGHLISCCDLSRNHQRGACEWLKQLLIGGNLSGVTNRTKGGRLMGNELKDQVRSWLQR